MVCFAWAIQKSSNPVRLIGNTQHFNGDRQAIREQACVYALDQLIQILSRPDSVVDS
jgi:nicotinamide-nucleotide amidase